ncbi:MAG: hypothetical protein ABUT20_31190 [Bacteroidota bacterium]
MKKLLIVMAIAAITLAACNSNKEEAKPVASTETTSMADVTYPYPISYSSKFELADPKYGQIILGLWKDWDNGTLSNSKDAFADSVEMHFADGSMMHSVRDSVLAAGQMYRDMYTKAVSEVNAVTALRSMDKDENWALVWGKEVDTDKKGKVDSFYLQETWRFNKAGKVDLLYQYKAAGTPPK